MKTGRGQLLAGTALAIVLGAGQGQANPVGPRVAAGAATVARTGRTLTVNQTTNRAIVNWRSFSIGAGETTRIQQPSAKSAILNRVTGADPSVLRGQLSSNGQVYLINPNGILVGPNGRIDTGAFVGSTLDPGDSAFLQGGALPFTGQSPAGIRVLGTVQASQGDVVLLAASVDNAGRIAAPNGQAILASGGQLLYLPGGNGDILIQGPSAKAADGASVSNSGVIAAASAQLKAAGGPYALAVNAGGAISATAVHEVGGRVVIDGGKGDAVVTGTLTAKTGTRGGEITVTGGRVTLDDGARIDVSAPAGGGSVSIGGGAHGADSRISNALSTTITSGARIEASATENGDGGAVAVWADGTTRFSGSIRSNGGALAGAGGKVEVSGHALSFTGRADLAATHGRVGQLLLDPADLDIDAPTAAAIELALQTSSDTVIATNSLTVSSPISSSSSNALVLNAPTISIDADIFLPNGGLQFLSPSTGVLLTSADGTTVTADNVLIGGTYDAINLEGALVTHALTVDQPGISPVSIDIANGSNSIDQVSFVAGHNILAGDLHLSSNSAMSVSGTVVADGSITLEAQGDLTMQSGAAFAAAGDLALASIGGAFINQAGVGLTAGNGRTLIYSSTDGGGFTDGGLGFPKFDSVIYSNDPHSELNGVIYIANSSGALPLLTITANDFSRLYGAADPVFTASFSGGSSSDLTAPVRFRLLQPSDVNAGVYTIEPFGAASSTRNLSFVDGTLTVNRAPLTITADNFSRPYGAANPAFSASFSGLVNGDTTSVVSGLGFSTRATTASNVGNYAITVTGGNASNYVITNVGGALTVNPAPLAITADNLSWVYGAANPALSASYHGLKNGDTPSVVTGLTITTTATSASDVGHYAIGLSGGSAANYAITDIDGTLTVNPAPLAITAGSATRFAYADNPVFSASYAGLVNGDDPSAILDLSFVTNALSISPAGTYTIFPIAAGIGSKSRDYLVSFTNGNLTVVSRPVPIVQTATFTPSNIPIIMLDIDTGPAKTVTTLTNNLNLDLGPVKVAPDKVLICDASCPSLGSAAQGELDKIIDTYAQALGSLTNPPVTADGLREALVHPKQAASVMGYLLPYIYSDLSGILGEDQSKWSPQQAAFVTAVQGYIQAQRQAAAQQATADYQAWAQKTQADITAQINAMPATAQVTFMGVVSSNPPVPPNSLLQTVNAGLSMNNGQLATYSTLTATAAGDESGYAAGGASDAGRITTLLAEGAGLTPASSDLSKLSPALKTILPKAESTTARALAKANKAFEAAEAIGDVAEAAEATKTIAAINKGLGAAEAIPVVGEIVEVVGNVMQAAIAIDQYAQISDFNKAFSGAVNAAAQPVTVSDLKQMMSSGAGQQQVFTYLTAMVATKGSPPTVTKPTMSLAQITTLAGQL